ncbi:unnamed protein product [Adineta ricciae]|uniref:Uncharacterized protein n=1 Tax=Adineta ricciae TaxID=249248 RepID=A0A813SIL9_ADIRI|nr:unnamed protein product [Adineta ricciae]
MIVCDDDDENGPDGNILPDGLQELTSRYAGKTFTYSTLSSIITNVNIEENLCRFRFKPRMIDYCNDQLLIGELTQFRTILGVHMIFYDQYNSIALDDDGNPIRYTSYIHDFGHVLNIIHKRSSILYIQCLLYLRPNSDFSMNHLFFHFPHSSSKLPPGKKGTITGSTSFSIDSNIQIYNVTVPCPSDGTCMWLLDDHIIVPQANISVTLIFHPEDIGNRTLSYVTYTANKPTILASLALSISPHTTGNITTTTTAPNPTSTTVTTNISDQTVTFETTKSNMTPPFDSTATFDQTSTASDSASTVDIGTTSDQQPTTSNITPTADSTAGVQQTITTSDEPSTIDAVTTSDVQSTTSTISPPADSTATFDQTSTISDAASTTDAATTSDEQSTMPVTAITSAVTSTTPATTSTSGRTSTTSTTARTVTSVAITTGTSSSTKATTTEPVLTCETCTICCRGEEATRTIDDHIHYAILSDTNNHTVHKLEMGSKGTDQYLFKAKSKRSSIK